VTPKVHSPCIIILVSGKASDGIEFEKLFTERDVHLSSTGRVYNYWDKKGGKDHMAGTQTDIYHLLKILGEKDGEMVVQFVGCTQSMTEWWSEEKVKETYIELWDEWVKGLAYDFLLPDRMFANSP
jgi:hypothetical protein